MSSEGREIVFKITDGVSMVSDQWLAVPGLGATATVRDLRNALKILLAPLVRTSRQPSEHLVELKLHSSRPNSFMQATVPFQVTTLSGSLLLPGTPLALAPAVAVRVAPSEYQRVLSGATAGSEEEEEEQAEGGKVCPRGGRGSGLLVRSCLVLAQSEAVSAGAVLRGE